MLRHITVSFGERNITGGVAIRVGAGRLIAQLVHHRPSARGLALALAHGAVELRGVASITLDEPGALTASAQRSAHPHDGGVHAPADQPEGDASALMLAQAFERRRLATPRRLG